MNDGHAAGLARFGRRLGNRVVRAVASDADKTSPTERSGAGPQGSTGQETGAQRRPPAAELAELRAAVRAAEGALVEATAERDRLRAERLRVQQELGAQHGMRVLPRLKVEKTNGVPSFVAGQRMMQRIFRRAEDPDAGIDRVGAVFADRSATDRFARSHGVPVVGSTGTPAGTTVVVHAFKGEVGLVELRGPHGARHLTATGDDPGDIRPAVPYDAGLPEPECLSQICSWSTVLSAHIPRPYVQVHWSPGPPRLDHIDVDPDQIPVLTPEWDRRLGSAFDGAYARFLLQPFRGGGLDNRVPGGTFTDEERA